MSCREKKVNSGIVYVTQRRLQKRMLVTQDSLDFFKPDAPCRKTSKVRSKERRHVNFDYRVSSINELINTQRDGSSHQTTNTAFISQKKVKNAKNSRHTNANKSKTKNNTTPSQCEGVNVIVSVGGASVKVQQMGVTEGVTGCVGESTKKNTSSRKMMKRTKGGTLKLHNKEENGFDFKINEVRTELIVTISVYKSNVYFSKVQQVYIIQNLNESKIPQISIFIFLEIDLLFSSSVKNKVKVFK